MACKRSGVRFPLTPPAFAAFGRYGSASHFVAKAALNQLELTALFRRLQSLIPVPI